MALSHCVRTSSCSTTVIKRNTSSSVVAVVCTAVAVVGPTSVLLTLLQAYGSCNCKSGCSCMLQLNYLVCVHCSDVL